MDLDRRAFLGTLAAAAVLPACKSDGPGPEPTVPFEPDGEVDADVFPYGVQVGDVTTDAAIVSVRCSADDVVLQLARGLEDGWTLDAELTPSPDDMGVAQAEFTDLRADTTYAIVATSGDGTARSVASRFRTAMAEGALRPVTFGATSCLGGNFPWACLSRAAEEQLDLFLLLGDTIYNDWWDGDLYDNWGTALEQQGFQDLCASTSLLATWDDHEVWNNWTSGGRDELAEEGIIELKRALPIREGGGDFGLWRSIRWGDTAEFFVLDCRSERAGSDYISEEQLQWLIDGLTASAARFKIILNSVPITDLSALGTLGAIGADDRWQGFPEQRTELLQSIADAGVTGVLFVSGDFHIGAVTQIDDDGGPAAGLYEVLSGPGGSPISDRWKLVPEAGRIKAAVTQHNYTKFKLMPATGDVEVTYVGNDGEALRTLTLSL